MKDLLTHLDALDATLGEIVSAAFGANGLGRASDEQVVAIMASAARVARRAEALLIEGAACIDGRDDGAPRDERITTHLGCATLGELIERTTRVSSRHASAIVKAGRAIAPRVSLTSGEQLPAAYPGVREAVAGGWIGIDGALAIVEPLAQLGSAVGRDAVLAADEELSAAARGEGADAAPPACADDLRSLAHVWAAYLDQDGAEPREERAARMRGVRLGRCRDGLVSIRGSLLPEVATQLQLIFDSILNPKVADGAAVVVPAPVGPRFTEPVATVAGGSASGSTPVLDDKTHAGADADPGTDVLGAIIDRRTRDQKQHDALSTALSTVAGSGALPTLGGAAPTLVIAVREEDLANGTGYAQITGCDEPIPLAAARRIACAGAVERVVFDAKGRIVSISTQDRIFNYHQRRAITLRDGGCIIPGCHVPAEWCEIHHVDPHGHGGKTHTDNGVLLCWHHHRTIETSGWEIRMQRGVPEVRAPRCWDRERRWRPVTKSALRMRDRARRAQTSSG